LKLDPGSGHSVSAVFVEDQIASLEVDWVLEFFWGGLIGTRETRRIGDQINLHVALGGDVTGFLVETKIVAVDLVETRGIAAIEHNADVVQLGVSVELELFDVAGLNGEDCALAIGFGKLEAAGGLLDVDVYKRQGLRRS